MGPAILLAEGQSYLSSLTNSTYLSMVQLHSQPHPIVHCKPAILGILFVVLNHAHGQHVCTSATAMPDDCRPSFHLPKS